MPYVIELASPAQMAPAVATPASRLASTTYGQAMLNMLPPVVRGSSSYQAVLYAAAKEVDRLEAALEQVRAQFNPGAADILLPAWEQIARLPVGGSAGQTVAQRQAAVLGRLQKVLGQSEGSQWVAAIDGIIGMGWSYLEHDPNDPSSPVDGMIQITLPFASGTPRWTEATQQIRDLTAAHLELAFISTATFELDVSELDVQQLNA